MPKPSNAVRLQVVPCELRDANDFVTRLHRHHKKATGHRWSCAVQASGETVGVAIVGRPVARMTDQRKIVEAIRVCTDGTPNACSALYGAVCRQQRAHAYEKAQTFILESEPGTSLRAAGWKPVAYSDGGTWSRPSRGGRTTPRLIARCDGSAPARHSPNSTWRKRHEVGGEGSMTEGTE